MKLGIPTTNERLRELPTKARSVIDPENVWVPPAYKVEVVTAGLSFPTGMAFADDGTLFINEGGSTWPTRPAMIPRILWLDQNGNMDVFSNETLGGPRGLAYRDGYLYATLKGGYYARVVTYNVKTGERDVINDKIPSGGWHEPGGPVFGPHDGLLYFAHGSVSLQGVVLPYGYTVDIAKHPHNKDIPGENVTLTGNNVWSRDPLMPYPYLTQTGPYKPFGQSAEKGEVIKGELWCTTGVWRSKPDGSEPELIAWGIRNPYGMAFSENGDLYISDNDFEEKGERAIAEDPDRIWHIPNAKKPHGSIQKPDWYGFPDICADGLPAWDKKHLPEKGKAAEPLLENPPKWAGPPAYLENPHTGMTKMDFCNSDYFGYRGKLFACEWGTLAPFNSPREDDIDNGNRVIIVDVEKGTGELFFKNKKAGPETGGIERPVDCKFSPDGKSLYVLDFGPARVERGYFVAFGQTGALWRITKE
jgi:glucose/arabinose dehydrogenase